MSLDSSEILAKLQGEGAPVSFAKLKAAFAGKKEGGHSEADLRAALNVGLSGGRIFEWPKKSYWHADPAARLNGEILRLCGEKASKKTELKVKGHSPPQVGAAVERLIAEKKLLKYPALSGSAQLFVSAGSPQAYWVYVRAFVAEKLKKAGIEEVGLVEKIWEVLAKLEPERDVPVSTGRLRRALGVGEADKQRFDEAALNLRDERRVYLSQHDHPLGLSAEDRDWLIDGKDGRYYVALTRRES